MTIDIRVAGDPTACSQCGAALSKLSGQIGADAKVFTNAGSVSTGEWTGQTADAFRTQVQAMASRTSDVGTHFGAAGSALATFGAALAGVKAAMSKAREVAAAAGLQTTDELIFAPRLVGQVTDDMIRKYNEQVKAYNAAVEDVIKARSDEKHAHDALDKALGAVNTAVDDAKKQWPWLVANEATGLIGTAVAQANKWGKVADDNSKALDYWKYLQTKFAGDPYSESLAARGAGAVEKDINGALKLSEDNAKLAAGLADTPLGQVLGASTKDAVNFFSPRLIPEAGAVAKIAEKVPVVGALVSTVQTGADVFKDRNKGAGQIAKDVGKDMGGFLAGTAATEGILALSAAGGPVTLVAVGAGIGVAYGVGEVIDHWGAISHTTADVAHDVGHAASSAWQGIKSIF